MNRQCGHCCAGLYASAGQPAAGRIDFYHTMPIYTLVDTAILAHSGLEYTSAGVLALTAVLRALLLAQFVGLLFARIVW